MNLSDNLGFFAAVLAMHFACAPEQSAEERKREVSERTVQRLEHAQGSYRGALETEFGFVPVYFKNVVLRNPANGAELPELQTSLTLGFFGGVTLVTSDTSFDFGAKRFVARFSGDRDLELKATLTKHSADATLYSDDLQWSWQASSDPIDTQNEIPADAVFHFFISGLREGNQNEQDAALTLVRRLDQTKAPTGARLPEFPGLDAAIRFLGTAIVANSARQVLYDPLSATIELTYESGARLLLSEVAAPDLETLQRDRWFPRSRLNGTLLVGAANVANFTAISGQLQLTAPGVRLPPSRFEGAYGSVANRPTYDVQATLTYLDDVGTSDDVLAFRQFPKMRLVARLCRGGDLLAKRTWELTSVDHLRGSLQFQLIHGNMPGELQLLASATPRWDAISGTVFSLEEPGESNAKLTLRAVNDFTPNKCKSPGVSGSR